MALTQEDRDWLEQGGLVLVEPEDEDEETEQLETVATWN